AVRSAPGMQRCGGASKVGLALPPYGAHKEEGEGMSIRPVKRAVKVDPPLGMGRGQLHLAVAVRGDGGVVSFLLAPALRQPRTDRPVGYRAGVPWHPHRGIETITYVLAGTVDHGDSLGNQGTLGAGDVQWMTAGSGILHQEMPKGDPRGRMHGFQLWANLPSL